MDSQCLPCVVVILMAWFANPPLLASILTANTVPTLSSNQTLHPIPFPPVMASHQSASKELDGNITVEELKALTVNAFQLYNDARHACSDAKAVNMTNLYHIRDLMAAFQKAVEAHKAVDTALASASFNVREDWQEVNDESAYMRGPDPVQSTTPGRHWINVPCRTHRSARLHMP